MFLEGGWFPPEQPDLQSSIIEVDPQADQVCDLGFSVRVGYPKPYCACASHKRRDKSPAALCHVLAILVFPSHNNSSDVLFLAPKCLSMGASVETQLSDLSPVSNLYPHSIVYVICPLYPTSSSVPSLFFIRFLCIQRLLHAAGGAKDFERECASSE